MAGTWYRFFVRLERPTRVVMVVAVLAALVACGLDVLATGDGPGDGPGAGDGAAADGAAADGAGFDDGSQVVLPPVPDPFLDAGLDVNPQNCLDGCDGGTCDGGWCVIDCSAQGSCPANVQCPPGIPCDVRCSGLGSCTQGVDCTPASACRIGCIGQGACTGKPVGCSGLGCKIDCAGLGSCSEGVDCDASTCSIACTGDGTCTGEAVTCNADICTIRCGVGKEVGKESCSQGIRCDTTQLCDIGCVAHNDCRNVPITAHSDGTSIVQCTGDTTCTRGSILSGGEAGVLCTGGMGACGQKTYCDAGKCFAACENDDLTFCCKGGPPACNTKAGKGCKISDGGC